MFRPEEYQRILRSAMKSLKTLAMPSSYTTALSANSRFRLNQPAVEGV